MFLSKYDGNTNAQPPIYESRILCRHETTFTLSKNNAAADLEQTSHFCPMFSCLIKTLMHDMRLAIGNKLKTNYTHDLTSKKKGTAHSRTPSRSNKLLFPNSKKPYPGCHGEPSVCSCIPISFLTESRCVAIACVSLSVCVSVCACVCVYVSFCFCLSVSEATARCLSASFVLVLSVSMCIYLSCARWCLWRCVFLYPYWHSFRLSTIFHSFAARRISQTISPGLQRCLQMSIYSEASSQASPLDSHSCNPNNAGRTSLRSYSNAISNRTQKARPTRSHAAHGNPE